MLRSFDLIYTQISIRCTVLHYKLIATVKLNVTVLRLVGLSQLKGDRRVGRLTTVRAERVWARDVAGLKRISRGMPGSGKSRRFRTISRAHKAGKGAAQ